jgi:hypothetical protein
MEIENMTAQEGFEWACNIIVELCEETESDPVLRQMIAGDDREGKSGAFARGRIDEARAIRDAVACVTRLLRGEAPIAIPPPDLPRTAAGAKIDRADG